MASVITITTNIDKVLNNLAQKIEKLKEKDYLLRPVAQETIANMKQRIHKDGLASDGAAIGNYSSSYLNYRKKNSRGGDTKIIVSLTRQLENDWSVLATEKGYGIGFNNSLNTQKARWVEQGQAKKIFNLTTKEKEYVQERLIELTDNALNS